MSDSIHLTGREKECLHWCSTGKTNREIGEILGLSERTIEHYLAATFEKLGAANRTDAVARAFKLGLIAVCFVVFDFAGATAQMSWMHDRLLAESFFQ